MITTSTLRKALLGSGAVLALSAGPLLADESENLKTQIQQLQGRLGQLEKQQAAADSKAVAAPADAVVGGDYPGSFKLPGSDTSYAIHGYTKLDFFYDFDQLLGDTFDVSALTSLKSAAQKRGGGSHLTARQSRLNFQSRTPTNYGQLKTYIEGDFFGVTAGQINGNNSHGFRLRHAYGQLGPVLAGQTWSNFIDIVDYPELLDFGGGAGLPFKRQPQIRYTQSFGKATLAVAIENPADITRPAATGAGEVTTLTAPAVGTSSTKPSIPDITGSVVYEGSWGRARAAGVLRRFEVDNGVGAGLARVTDDAIGYGGILSGTFNLSALGVGGMFAKDSIGAQAFGGSGIGAYLPAPGQGVGQGTFVNYTNTGGVPTDAHLFTTAAYGGAVFVQHLWTDQLRSNLSYGINNFHNPASLAFSTTQSDRLQTAYANLIWSPVKAVNIGLEFIYGARLQRAGANGDQNESTAKRMQVALQYAF